MPSLFGELFDVYSSTASTKTFLYIHYTGKASWLYEFFDVRANLKPDYKFLT